jgi:hypothetical protein
MPAIRRGAICQPTPVFIPTSNQCQEPASRHEHSSRRNHGATSLKHYVWHCPVMTGSAFRGYTQENIDHAEHHRINSDSLRDVVEEDSKSQMGPGYLAWPSIFTYKRIPKFEPYLILVQVGKSSSGNHQSHARHRCPIKEFQKIILEGPGKIVRTLDHKHEVGDRYLG